MINILVTFKPKLGEKQFFNASNKAQADVRLVALRSGFDERLVEYNNRDRFISLVTRIIGFAQLLYRLPKGSKLLIQYPFLPLWIHWFFRWVMRSKFYCIAVVHDLNSVREHGRLDRQEQGALSVFKKLIVHTPSMKELLKSHLASDMEYEVLEVFPYLTKPNLDQKPVKCSLDTVVFAGNLHKSIFLKDLSQRFLDYTVYLYGASSPFSDSLAVVYKGRFMPDEVSGVDGTWGLVWDGESCDECSGHYGEYLEIIASHKISLYIACGKPVIVWSKSAMASFVSKHGIGILVDSLDQVGRAIRKANYDEVLKSVGCVSRDYISGDYLSTIMKQICNND